MMSRSSSQLPEVQFHNPRLSKLGVEVVPLDVLRHRIPDAELASPQRVDFLMLMLVESGRGVHIVDFVQHALCQGMVLLVKPGQVQQWRMAPSLQAQLVLVSPAALGASGGVSSGVMSLLALDIWSTTTQPSAHLFQKSLDDLQRLTAELEGFDGSDGAIAIARHALVTLLLRLAHETHTEESRGAVSQDRALHRLFVQQLDALYMLRMGVVDYARRLGYSESTLSRACVDAVGYTAKQLIDRRVALEAKRMLAHSRETVVQIGHQLGFSEPTNFVKFFRRMSGETPLSFRNRVGLAKTA